MGNLLVKCVWTGHTSFMPVSWSVVEVGFLKNTPGPGWPRGLTILHTDITDKMLPGLYSYSQSQVDHMDVVVLFFLHHTAIAVAISRII